MRDLLILGIIYASLPVILVRPFFGLLVYAWLAYMRPQDMAWAVARQASLSEWVAIALFIGLALTLGRERPLTFKPQTVLLILLVTWISITVTTAILPELSSIVYGHYWKGILIAVLMTGMVRTKGRVRLVFILLAFSIGLMGAKFGLFGLLRGGTRFDHGTGGMMGDNNHFAVGLNMALPLLIGVVIVEREKWLRVASLAMAVLSILTIFFTFSRGGLLTLLVVGGLLIWRSKRKALAGVVVVLGVAGFLTLSSAEVRESYFGRAGTITDYDEDGSAMGRLTAWRAAWRVFKDYPVFGVGPDNFQAVFERYSDNPERFRVAHNSYLQLLSECGLPGLALFLLTLGVTLWRLDLLRRRAREPWVEAYASMLQISILGYMAGSMFLNLAYFELSFGLIGLSTALEVAAVREGAVELPLAAGRRRRGGEELPWWKRPAVSPALPSHPAHSALPAIPAIPAITAGTVDGAGMARGGNL